MKTLKIAATAGLIGLSLVTPFLAGAQYANQGPIDIGNDNAFVYILRLLDKLATYMLTVLIVLAAAFIIWAAFNYLTAGGNPEKVEAATKMIVYAAVAIGIGLLAKIITLLAQQFVQR